MNTKIRFLYKELCRRNRRLPLDGYSSQLLQNRTKAEFLASNISTQRSSYSKRKYERFKKILDEVLVEVRIASIEKILDLIYKEKSRKSRWRLDLMQYSSQQLKPWWPEVHFLRELRVGRKTSEYDSALRMERQDQLCLLDYFGLKRDNIQGDLVPLSKLSSRGNEDHIMFIVEKASKLHSFLLKNQDFLTHLKIRPFEVAYPSNRLGLPLHIRSRDKILKQKVLYSKNLIKSFLPMDVKDLDHLVKVAVKSDSSLPPYQLNPNFFKFMRRKINNEKHTLSPRERRERHKRLVPSDKNIRKIFRSYVKRQFYYDKPSNEYKICWMQNFYENENRLLSNIDLP